MRLLPHVRHRWALMDTLYAPARPKRRLGEQAHEAFLVSGRFGAGG